MGGVGDEEKLVIDQLMKKPITKQEAKDMGGEGPPLIPPPPKDTKKKGKKKK
jgi:hypothetical protein